jgi:replication-associated recombination protein RarA
MSSNRLLSLCLRPKNLQEYLGQENLVTLLENQFYSGRIPHFYILHGHTGSGKTVCIVWYVLPKEKEKEKEQNTQDDTEECHGYSLFGNDED